eukprot:m.241415 g.241415  ORF g.241415 m.241415 type:complete len:398 (+) comp13848_c0_seq1:468-1661(+)
MPWLRLRPSGSCVGRHQRSPLTTHQPGKRRPGSLTCAPPILSSTIPATRRHPTWVISSSARSSCGGSRPPRARAPARARPSARSPTPRLRRAASPRRPTTHTRHLSRSASRLSGQPRLSRMRSRRRSSASRPRLHARRRQRPTSARSERKSARRRCWNGSGSATSSASRKRRAPSRTTTTTPHRHQPRRGSRHRRCRRTSLTRLPSRAAPSDRSRPRPSPSRSPKRRRRMRRMADKSRTTRLGESILRPKESSRWTPAISSRAAFVAVDSRPTGWQSTKRCAKRCPQRSARCLTSASSASSAQRWRSLLHRQTRPRSTTRRRPARQIGAKNTKNLLLQSGLPKAATMHRPRRPPRTRITSRATAVAAASTRMRPRDTCPSALTAPSPSASSCCCRRC